MFKIRSFNGNKLIQYYPRSKFFINVALFFGMADGLSVFMSGLTKEEQANLSEFYKIGSIFLQDCKKDMNFYFLKQLTKLQDITIDGYSPRLDISNFSNLKSLSLDWRHDVFKNIKGSGLTKLDMWKYNEKDLRSIVDFRELRKLSLYQSNIETLDGIENFINLEHLNLFLNRKIIDLSSLTSTSIKTIAIENSKKISDYSFLEKCANLEEIKIHDSSPIPSLSFVYKLHKLKNLRFVGTKVIDGDMSPLLKMEDFYFDNMKHYSHKYEDIA